MKPKAEHFWYYNFSPWFHKSANYHDLNTTKIISLTFFNKI